MYLKKISVVLGIVLAIFAVITTASKLDGRWAKSKDVEIIEIEVRQTERRLEQKIQEDRSYNIQERIWKLEDRYGYEVDKMPDGIRDQYRILKTDKEKIDKSLDQLLEPPND